MSGCARSSSPEGAGPARTRSAVEHRDLCDSRSLKTTEVGGEEQVCDPGKEVKGRRRHLLLDTEGLVLKEKIHAASVCDRDGIKPLMKPAGEGFPRLYEL